MQDFNSYDIGRYHFSAAYMRCSSVPILDPVKVSVF